MLYVLLSFICWIEIYPLDSVICPGTHLSGAFLVGDHSLSSPDLNVCFMGDNVRRNWMLVTLIGERDNHIDFSFDFMV